MYSIRRTVEPTLEPVTLSLAKSQCRLDLDDSSEDELLTLYIRTAREYCEGQTGRSLLQQTWLLTREGFHLRCGLVPLDHVPVWRTSRIPLPRGRVLAVASVKYYDTSNTLQTLDPSLYIADVNSEPARIAPAPGKWWPSTACRSDAVQVTYTAGYGTVATAVPASVCMAMLLLIGHWYENREATQAALTGNGPLPLPLGVDALLENCTDYTLTYEA